MMTATRTRKTTRKPAEKPARSAHLSQIGDKQILWLTIGEETQAYGLTQLETDYGVAGFHLSKADKGDGHAEEYDLLIHGNESSCTCPDHTYRRRECKHLAAIASLIRAGKIAVPQQKLAPVTSTVELEDL
jgi:hypothetical protein